MIVAGSATRDAELKLVGSKNTPLCTFGMAVGRDENDASIYVNVKSWRDLAEYAAGIRKGMPVFAAGKVEEREYEGKVYKDLVAEFLMYLDHTPAPTFTEVEDDGELPF